ncbi:MAG: hypothetical protein Kow0069_12180 [Promethearchaeota archaeon]
MVPPVARAGPNPPPRPFVEFWSDSSLGPLLQKSVLAEQVKRDPWKIGIRRALASYLEKASRLPCGSFKVHGRVLRNASYLLRVQSGAVVVESAEARSEIGDAMVHEAEGAVGGCGEPGALEHDAGLDGDPCAGLDADFDAEGEVERWAGGGRQTRYFSSGLPVPAVRRSKDGAFLAPPAKLPVRRATVADLAGALREVLAREERRRARSGERPGRKAAPRKASLSRLVLPENVLAKAEEERASAERFRERTLRRVRELSVDRPVDFSRLVEEPTPLGVARALLTVLHLVNEKKVELFLPDAPGEPAAGGVGVLVAPAGRFAPRQRADDD